MISAHPSALAGARGSIVSNRTFAAGTVTARILPTATSRPVRPGFVGVSLEYRWVPAYAGSDPAAVNPVFVRLLSNLVSGGGQPVLRIGGDSTDWTWWPAPSIARPPGVSFTLTPSWIATVRRLAFALDARLVLGINLEADNPALASAEAHALIAGLGRSRIEAFELGNEPEAYGLRWYVAPNGQVVAGRPVGYGPMQYSADLARFRRLLGGMPLAGPTTGAPSWLAHPAQLIRSEPTLRVVTYHRYPLNRCVTDPASPEYPSITHLLSGSSSRGLVSGIARFAALAHRARAVFRVDELNSVTCQGKAGVSDTFASALWLLDTLFEMVRSGVDAVNIHTWPGALANELFTFHRVAGHWTSSVRPLYYGALMFTRAAPPGSRLLQTRVTGAAAVQIWATTGADGTIRVIAINDSRTDAYRVLVRTPGGAGTGRLERMTAPSAYARTGVRLGGQSFGTSTATGSLAGAVRASTLAPAGAYTFRLPSASAAMLTVAPAPGRSAPQNALP